MEYNIIIYFSLTFNINKRQRIPQRQSIMDNPEKLATQGTQDEDKTQHNMCWTLLHVYANKHK